MKYYIVTGETSGDLIGSLIAKQLIQLDSLGNIKAWGGTHLKHVGVQIDQDIDSMNAMGFGEVFSQILHYQNLLKQIKDQLLHFNPDVLILIDFGGFNMRVGEWAYKKGINTIYISPPKTWASRSYRNKKLLRYFNKLIVLFPFEKEYFDAKEIRTEFYGHPLFENINIDIEKIKRKESKLITLAPGSRPQEVKQILSLMLDGLSKHKEHKYIVSCAPNINHQIIEDIISPYDYLDISVSKEPLEKLLSLSSYALVTSGTATLEACKMHIPQIVCYKTSKLNYLIAKVLLKTKYISLPNLILNKAVVTELIQDNLSPSNISMELDRLMSPIIEKKVLEDYKRINSQLSMENCAENIAKAIMATVK